MNWDVCEKCQKPWHIDQVHHILEDGKIYAIQEYNCWFCGFSKTIKELIDENPEFEEGEEEEEEKEKT